MYKEIFSEWGSLPLNTKVEVASKFILFLWLALTGVGILILFYYVRVFSLPASIFLPSIFSVSFFVFALVALFAIFVLVLFSLVLCAFLLPYALGPLRNDFRWFYICLLYGIGFYGLNGFGVIDCFSCSVGYLISVTLSFVALFWLVGLRLESFWFSLLFFIASCSSYLVFRLLFWFEGGIFQWVFVLFLFVPLFLWHKIIHFKIKSCTLSYFKLFLFLLLLVGFAGDQSKFALITLSNLGVVDPVKSVFLQGKDSSGELIFGDRFYGPELNGGCPSWKDAVMNSGRAICGYRNYNFGGYSVICNKPSFLVYEEIVKNTSVENFYCVSMENKEIPSVIRASQ